MKRLEFFDLNKDNNETRFNLTSEFTVEIIDSIQNYKLVAIHPNRTITWKSDYHAEETSTKHNSRIELSENIWLEYHFGLKNLSVNEIEGQEISVSVLYPGREVSARGNYELKPDAVNTNVNLQWNKAGARSVEEDEELEGKTVEGSFQWKDLTDSTNDNHQFVRFALKHPKFEKDVTVQGIYFKSSEIIGKVEVDIDYTEDESHHAKFLSIVKNVTKEVGYKNYTVHVNGDHDASDFHLLLDGSIGVLKDIYKVEANGNYKRGYLPDMDLEFLTFIDFDLREGKFYVSFG